jgi:hypothetical protein
VTNPDRPVDPKMKDSAHWAREGATKKEQFEALNKTLERIVPDLKQVDKPRSAGGQKVEVLIQ